MPELPEVEGVRRTLENLIIGKEISSVSASYPQIVKSPESFEAFAGALVGECFHRIARKGKFLILLTDHYAIVSHLRMEGKYILSDHTAPYTKHMHVYFTFTDGSELRYADVRKFGTMHLTGKDTYLEIQALKKLGPDGIAEGFHERYLYQQIKNSQRTIKNLLLNQEIVAGLGNIYVDEVLFRARIHPMRIGAKLKKKEREQIIIHTKEVLNQAIMLGGSTIRTYQNAQGLAGTFQNELKVYGQYGLPCHVCHTPIEKIKVSGRGTHFCPSCQK